MPFVKVASTQEIAPGSGKTIEVNGHVVALFNVDGNFYAIDNTCAHQGGPLGEGMLDGTTVVCPWHAWEYDVTTGKCLTNPSAVQKQFNVKIEGEDIFVEI